METSSITIFKQFLECSQGTFFGSCYISLHFISGKNQRWREQRGGESGRWREREVERVGGGESGRWREREVERVGGGESGRWREREVERGY